MNGEMDRGTKRRTEWQIKEVASNMYVPKEWDTPSIIPTGWTQMKIIRSDDRKI